MKPNFYLATTLMCMAIFASCSQNEAVIERLESQADSLRLVNGMQQEALDDLTAYVAQISNALDSITIYEGILTVRVDENGRALGRKKVLENLAILEGVLARKRTEIQRLDSLLNVRNDQVRNLTSLVQHLFTELDAKEETIQKLRDEVNAQNIKIRRLTTTVDTLINTNSSLSVTVSNLKQREKETQEEMSSLLNKTNEVWYIIGTRKELNASGVLSSGSLFKKTALSGSIMDAPGLISIDARQVKEIPISGLHPEIKSPLPPEDSYTLTSTSLTIHNPDRFWAVSKYLVIQIR